jgi:exo-1,4-beta-D-glucosaminidase
MKRSLGFAFAIAALCAAAHDGGAQTRRMLQSGWTVQSSEKVGLDGAKLSSPTYHAGDWYKATVPSTVVGTLVDDGVYKDPFFGMNLRDIPGMTYNIGLNFVHLPMDPTSPFAKPWWYRTTFRAAAAKGEHVVLHFDGINYRANVWLNGKRLSDSTQVAGTYRRYEFDITRDLRAGSNALAVEVFAPTPADLQTTWVDWNPSPPDKDMGLWQPVYLATTGDVSIEYPHATSQIDVAARTADVRVGTNLKNLSDNAVTGELSATIGGTRVHQEFTLAARDSSYVELPAAHVANARFWWPAELGRPELYDLDVAFDVHGQASDRQNLKVGIREVTAETTPRGGKLFRVNGQRILIRGGGWAPDMFFRPQPRRQDDQLAYALDMHLNTIRLEGNYENDRFFQRTDSLGILVMTGWVCCDAWEEWPKWGAEQRTVAATSLRDQIRRLRAHPSVFVWLNGSDNPPPADVEQTYLNVERDEHWPNPVISSASAKPTTVTGASGVKMTGPYDWVPPSYWLQDSTHGGAWAYNTETSPGAAVPPIESIRRMMPARDIAWPLDSVWLFHAAGGQFTHLLDRFNDAMTKRFGAPTSAEDYTVVSQLMTYEGERAMFEAYRRNKYTSTGVIQWMFNNAWPSIYWHLFDWYLRPAGGYFGAKKANEPVHAMFSYDDRSVAVINARKVPVPNVHVRTRLIGLDGSDKFTRDTTFDLPADTTMRLFTLPEPAGIRGAYFADIRVTGGSPSFYWLSTTPDVLADTSTWYMTPVKSYADYTALRTMPKTSVRSTATFSQGAAQVTLTNTGRAVAFFIRLQVVGAKGEEALPVFWDDNYVSLLPGETRKLTARYRPADLRGSPKLVVSGWNVERSR